MSEKREVYQNREVYPINIHPVFNPVEAILKMHEEKMELYERMLKEKDEMMERLEKLIEKR